MEPEGLGIERQAVPSGLRFRLVGELDASNAASAARVLLEALDGQLFDVELDLSEMEFVGVAGLHVLDELHRQLTQRGRELRVVASCAVVERALDVSGIRLPGASCTARPQEL